MKKAKISIGSYDYDGLVRSFIRQDRPSAKTAEDRMSYSGTNLYSYNANIAKLDGDTILLNADYICYSHTTTKHFRALSTHTREHQVFTIPFNQNSERQLQYYWDKISQAITEFRRARAAWVKDSHRRKVKALYHEALAFVAYSKIDKRSKVYRSNHIRIIQEMLLHKLLGD